MNDKYPILLEAVKRAGLPRSIALLTDDLMTQLSLTLSVAENTPSDEDMAGLLAYLPELEVRAQELSKACRRALKAYLQVMKTSTWDSRDNCSIIAASAARHIRWFPKSKALAVPRLKERLLAFSVSLHNLLQLTQVVEHRFEYLIEETSGPEVTALGLGSIVFDLHMLHSISRSTVIETRELIRSMETEKQIHPYLLESLIQKYENGLARNPTDHDTWIDLAEAYLDYGDTQKAEEAIQTALQIAPDLSRAHVVAGRIAAQRDALDQSLVHLSKAVTLSPRYVAAWVELAKVQLRRGDSQLALRTIEKALGFSPTNTLLRRLYTKAVNRVRQKTD